MATILAPYGGGTLVGSIGSTTFQRGRYGNVARQRVKPVNPNSNRQQFTRQILNYLSNKFANDLTAAQVTAWNQYAALTNMREPGGGPPIHITGKDHFVRSSFGPVFNGAPGDESNTAPTVPGLANLPLLNFDFFGANTTLRLTASGPSIPANGFVIIRLSPLLKNSINFFKGPYAFTSVVEGTDALPFSLHDYSAAAVSGQRVGISWKLWNKITAGPSTFFKCSKAGQYLAIIP